MVVVSSSSYVCPAGCGVTLPILTVRCSLSLERAEQENGESRTLPAMGKRVVCPHVLRVALGRWVGIVTALPFRLSLWNELAACALTAPRRQHEAPAAPT